MCPEDVFGLRAEELKHRYGQLAKLVHEDKHHTARGKKLAHEAFVLLQKWHKLAERRIADGIYGDRSTASTAVVKTKTNEYTVTSRIASGDICEIYAATDKDANPVALKVPRAPANNDLTNNEATKLREIWACSRVAKLSANRHIPKLLDSFDLVQSGVTKRVNVFTRLEGYFSLQEVIDAFPTGLDPRDAAWMWNRLLAALVLMHSEEFVHGAVLPSNVMICPDKPMAHNGILIDWCYATKEGGRIRTAVTAELASYPPEVLAKKPASATADVYMSAVCMVRLLGGSVSKPGIKIPETLPRPIRGLLKACLLSAGHRPREVFEVFSDFEKILKDVYGTRKFRPFSMPTKN